MKGESPAVLIPSIFDFVVEGSQQNRYMKIAITINTGNAQNGYRYQHTC